MNMLNNVPHQRTRNPLPTIAFALMFLAHVAHSENTSPRPYEPTLETLTKITGDLHQALNEKHQRAVSAEPQVLNAATGFFIAPVSNGPGPAAVGVSPSFVGCLNQLAHARALEPVAGGYLPQYVLALPQTGAQPWAPVGKSLPAEQAWSFDAMNHQVSLFNQMAGSLIAIQLAHHYLGHTRKAPAAAADGATPPPITDRLSEKEWRDAVLKGAKNALDCGLGVEGFRALLGAVGKQSERPRWSACFVHPKTDVTKLSRELEKLEKDFFLVGQ